jgi:hypothetical protein
MADLFSVTAPLAIRFKDTGEKQIMVARLPYNNGLLFLPTFWTNMEPQQALRYVPGPVEGAGPWKVGNTIVTVLACHGTDAALANDFSCWQSHLMELGEDYPDDSEIALLMKTHAADVAGLDHCHPEFRALKNQE